MSPDDQAGMEAHDPEDGDSRQPPWGSGHRLAGAGADASGRTLWQRVSAADRIVAPMVLFLSLYVAAFLLLTWLRFPFAHWSGLMAVCVASALSVTFWERGRWSLGLLVSPRLILRDSILGGLFGVVLIGACASLVVATTDLFHLAGEGFPWTEVWLVFLPAAVHEELLFRGYGFQKLHRWNRPVALFLVALVFAALHAGNASVSNIGLFNIFLGGVLLGLAWERYRRLWFPIGLHLAWNLMSGPVLGHEVSGYDSSETLFVERGSGPPILTGGEFGIEGSIWMTLLELLGIALLLVAGRRREARMDTGAGG